LKVSKQTRRASNADSSKDEDSLSLRSPTASRTADVTGTSTIFVTRNRVHAWSKELLVPGAFLTVAVLFYLRPLISGQKMPGDLADTRFMLSLLELFYRNVVALLHGKTTHFLNAPFFYPWPRVANFSDTLWGDAEIYVLFRALRLGSLGSFQAWSVTGFLLTYIATLISLRSLGLKPWGAAAGAFLFTFPLPMTNQIVHAQFIYRLWIPAALTAFDRCLTRASLRHAAWCLLFVALQCAVAMYLGLFLCLLLAAYVLGYCLFARDRLAWNYWQNLCTGGLRQNLITGLVVAAAIGLLLLVGIPYMEVQSMYGFARSWAEVSAMLPRPGSYLLAAPSKFWPNLSAYFAYPYLGEHEIFPGLSALIPLLWFLVSKDARRRKPLATPMLASAVFLVVLTLDLNGHSFYRLIFTIPGFSGIRAVTRVILIIMMPLAALLGLLIDDLTSHSSPALIPRSIAVVLSLFLLFECSYVHEDWTLPSEWQARVAALNARLPKILPPDSILAIAGPGHPGEDTIVSFIETAVDAQLVAIERGIPTLNGYGGEFPPSWEWLGTCEDVIHDLRAGRHFLREQDLPVPTISPSHIVLVGLANCQLKDLDSEPILFLNHIYNFAKGGDGEPLVGDGFSTPEDWGRWTNARSASLFFALPSQPVAPIALTINAVSFSAARKQAQSVTVKANGQDCGKVEFAANRQRSTVSCPLETLRSGTNMLTFLIDHPARPSDRGRSQDDRLLGLGIKSINFRGQSP
jgi:hypothetical protein